MEFYSGVKKVISIILKIEKGFELEINEILTFEQFKTVGFESLKGYDLVLVDLNLDDDRKWCDSNKIIEEIQKQ